MNVFQVLLIMFKRLRHPANLPVLAGALGVGRLVRVARVLRLVVHVSGRQWAGLTSPASSSSASSSASSSQLTLAFGDGFGGECEGQLEQVNLAPEGIYLGGWRGGQAGKVGYAGGGAFTERRGGEERVPGRKVELRCGWRLGGCDLEETSTGGEKVRLHLRLCPFKCECHIIITIQVVKQLFPTGGVSGDSCLLS